MLLKVESERMRIIWGDRGWFDCDGKCANDYDVCVRIKENPRLEKDGLWSGLIHLVLEELDY